MVLIDQQLSLKRVNIGLCISVSSHSPVQLVNHEFECTPVTVLSPLFNLYGDVSASYYGVNQMVKHALHSMTTSNRTKSFSPQTNVFVRVA